MSGPLVLRSLLLSLAVTACLGCARSHAPAVSASAPDAAIRDAVVVDGGDYIPGDPDMPADLGVWQQYCIRMAPLVAGQSRSYAEVACVRDVTYVLTCMPTIREMNHCLDVARSLYDGGLLDITMVPECHDLCPHD